MALEREGRNGPYVISCDECSETIELEGESFIEALHDAVKHKWGYTGSPKEGYKHFCRDCRPW